MFIYKFIQWIICIKKFINYEVKIKLNNSNYNWNIIFYKNIIKILF
jgi:hypothetical protein